MRNLNVSYYDERRDRHIFPCGCEQEDGGRWLLQHRDCTFSIHTMCNSIMGIVFRLDRFEERIMNKSQGLLTNGKEEK